MTRFNQTPPPQKRSTRPALLPLLTLLAAGFITAAAHAATSTHSPAHTVRPGFGGWWLPYDYSTHGPAIDALFNVIFWITTVTFVIVETALVVFLIKYRSTPDRKKGKFIHGNTRLEMVWTLAPAVILAVLALASKGVWDRYRYAEDYYGPKDQPVEVLVIGEQFKWNFVYPGKDGRLGQYMVFPQPSDPDFRKVAAKDVFTKINSSIGENPLGQNKNFGDGDAKYGADDDYDINPGRPLVLPVDRPIAIRLSSKDVIHDFFLPNFRVKLDALPGMAGRIDFTATTRAQSTEEVPVDKAVGLPIWVDSRTRGAVRVDAENVSAVNYAIKLGDVTLESRKTTLTPEHVAALKAANYDKVTVIARAFDLVCEELCGQGHYSMGGTVYFVSKEQYADFVLKPDPVAGPTTRPTVSSIK